MPGKGCFVAPRNLELAREDTLRRVEEHLSQAVDAARTGGVSDQEVKELLGILLGDEIV